MFILAGQSLHEDSTADINCDKSNMEQMESPEGYLVNNIDLLGESLTAYMGYILMGMIAYSNSFLHI